MSVQPKSNASTKILAQREKGNKLKKVDLGVISAQIDKGSVDGIRLGVR